MPTRVGHWKLDECDIYIGRGSIWGNPFASPEVAHRSQFDVIVSDDPVADFENWIATRHSLLLRLPELREKILGCYCVRLDRFDKRCHGHVLARLADAS